MTLSEVYQKEPLPRAERLYDAQAVLFSPQVSRLALAELQLPLTGSQRVRVNVWRNHAIESVASLMAPYCAYGGWQADFRMSGYDDTLIFTDWQEADVELLWLDSSRFLAHTSFDDWSQWLKARIWALRKATAAPIILATWTGAARRSEALQALADSIPAVFFADLEAACVDAQAPFLNRHTASMAGTPVGKAAQLALARKLACHWLPATLFPPVKAIVLDLDQTLHHGVLGEDGIDGLQLTPGHIEFQRFLKSQQLRGIFLALISRNESTDVEALFAQRTDYPLRWEDFSATEVSWRDKVAAIEQIAERLRIAPDSMLFVDDNPGELGSVTRKLPQTHTILAHPNASLTSQVVHFHPGLWRWKTEDDDLKRFQDVRVNVQRNAVAEHLDTPEEYFRSLQIALWYRQNPRDQLNRLADLCSKTNQFNLALRRFNQADLAERVDREDACVTSIRLTDRFADSGVIGVVVAERRSQQLVVEELCISCRALSRQLESTIVILALREMPIFAGCREVVFRAQQGPRNRPALDWLARFLDRGEMLPPGPHAASAQRLLDFIAIPSIFVNRG